MEDLVAIYEKMKPLIMGGFRDYHALGMDCDDLWQEVLIDGITHQDEYNPELSKPETWATNRGIWRIKTILRKNGREPYCSDVCEIDVEAKYGPEPIDVYSILMGFSEELPSRERIVFKYYLYGYSFEKTGQHLGVTRQRVHVIFNSAIRRLRRNHRAQLENIDLRKSRRRH